MPDCLHPPLPAAARAEVRAFALFAALALAVAGVFALLLAISRVPGSGEAFPWPTGFFGKGLVIHVTFSFVIWLLTTYAALATITTARLGGAARGRLLTVGALCLTCLSFPLLFLPAFSSAAEASLNNYVPVIIHPAYYAALAALALAMLLVTFRMFAALFRHGVRDVPAFDTGVLAAGFIYCVAFIVGLLALWHLWGDAPSHAFNEDLFWGAGHVLQYMNTALMLSGFWLLLKNTALGEEMDDAIARIAFVFLALYTLGGIILFVRFEPFIAQQTEAFTKAQYFLAFPVLLVGVGGLVAARRMWRAGRWPKGDIGLLAAMLAVPVFVAGGLMGLLVDGADTRTPAHYHAVIAGVNLVLMGLFLKCLLPAIGRPAAAPRLQRALLWLFGVGQLLAAIGLFWAGGHGAPRKVAGEAQGLVDAAKLGMALNGIGALLAIIGGVLFIWLVLAALLRKAARRDGRPA